MPERGDPDEGGAGHGSEAVWLLCQDKVTRCKSGTDSRNTLDNGYSPEPNPEACQSDRIAPVVTSECSYRRPRHPLTTEACQVNRIGRARARQRLQVTA